MLAGVADRTHFPTLTGASRNVIAAWSVRPGESDLANATKPPDLPVRSYDMKKRNSLMDDSFIFSSLVAVQSYLKCLRCRR
jgi:hypothetical protein